MIERNPGPRLLSLLASLGITLLGTTPALATTGDLESPTVPGILEATVLSTHEVFVSWTPSTDNVGVTEYRVRRDGALIATVPATSTAALDSGLAPDSLHDYTVTAADAAGNESASSATFVAKTYPERDTLSLVAAFGFEGTGTTILDESGNDNDGTLVPNAMRSPGAPFGSAVRFDGGVGQVDLGDLEVLGSQLTLSAWVRLEAQSLSEVPILTKAGVGPRASRQAWTISIDPQGQLVFRLSTRGGASSPLTSTGSPVAQGTWTHVAATYDGAAMRLYQDGVLVGSQARTGAIAPGPSLGVRLGHEPLSGAPSLVGQVDEVFLFAKALDATKIDRIMTTPASAFLDTLSPGRPVGVQTVALGMNDVLVSWDPPPRKDGVASHRILRDGVIVGAVQRGSTQFHDLLVTSGTTYTYNVVAGDLVGNLSGPSSPGSVVMTPLQTDTTAPSQPTLTATPVDETSVQLNWTAATDNVGVTGYRVRRDGGDLITLGPGVLAHLDTGLTVVTSYDYDVVAFDAAGNETPSNLEFAVTPDLTPPSAPTGLMGVSLSNTSIQIDWNPSTDNVQVDAYKVRRDGAVVATLDESTLQFVDVGLAMNTAYDYEVLAVDTVGLESALSTTIQVSTSNVDFVPPSAPGAFSATPVGETSAQLSWTAATDNFAVTGYRVRRDGADLVTLGPGALAHLDTGLTVVTTYAYDVVAFDAAGNETASSVEIAVTPDLTPPTAPTGVMGVALSNTSIQLGWIASTDNVQVDGYEIRRDGAVVANLNGATLVFLDAGLTINTTYDYQVRAIDSAALESPLSATAQVTTLNVDEVPPSAPGSFTATPISEDSVQLAWTASTDNVAVTGYRVRRDGGLVATLADTDLSFLDTGLTADTTYSYTVAAFDAEDNEAETAPELATTPDLDDVPPSVPGAFSASPLSVDSVQLAWTAATDNVAVIGYRVRRDGGLVATLPDTDLSFLDTGLTADTTYSYTVAAFDAEDNETETAPELATTLIADAIAPSVPGAFSATPLSANSVQLTWTASTDNIAVTGYRVRRDGGLIATLADTALSYNDFSLTGDTTYSYTVAAFDAADNENETAPELATTLPDTSDPSLIAAYGFEDGPGNTVLDASGNGYDGILTGATRGPGYFGQGIVGDGIASTVDVGTFDVAGGTGVTLAMWVRPASFTLADARLIAKTSGVAEQDHYWMISRSSGDRLRFRVKTDVGGTETLVTGGPVLTLDTWTHVAATFDGTFMRIYVNALEVASTPKAGLVLSDPGVFVSIGNTPQGGKSFHGDLDEVWVHNRALTPAEIATLMTTNIGAPAPDVVPPTTPSDVAAYAASTSRIDLHWSPSIDNIAVVGYQIHRDGVEVATVTGLEHQDTGLAIGTSYDYEILAEDEAGNLSPATPVVSISTLTTDSDLWWDNGWSYRVPFVVDSAGLQRTDKVVDVELDFTALGAAVGAVGAFDPGSVRVIEVNAAGQAIDPNVPFQFDPGLGFDANTNAVGDLVFQTQGWLPGTAERFFHVYFNTGTSMTPAVVPDQVSAVDNVMDEGQLSYELTTQRGVYYYQKTAGGFSSLLDLDGNDWIDFHPGGGSAGEFRGIPNLVYPDGYFHPGSVTATSTLLREGPLAIEIQTITNDLLWECRWVIYPHHAVLTVVTANQPYWFMYEGTPGGALEPATDYMVRPDGTQTPASVEVHGDLPDEEWAYFVDPVVDRGLFLVNHEEDAHHDTYRAMNGEMTVFGFGRQGTNSFLNATPATFTIGFLEDPAFEPASGQLRATTTPVGGGLGVPVMLGGVSSFPTGAQGLVATTLSSAEVHLTWTGGTDNVAVAGYRILRDGVDVGFAEGTTYVDQGLQESTTYSYQVVEVDVQGLFSPPSNTSMATTLEGLLIDVWYGAQQSFGVLGLTQPWINVMGRVTDNEGVASLSYSLNGGPQRTLTVGPDNRRLEDEGDFNIDLLETELLVGMNTLSIRAEDVLGNVRIDDIQVDYTVGTTWPRPHDIDWTMVTDLQEVCQVIDGHWDQVPTGIRTQDLGYDRLVGLGDQTWTDYEIEVNLTVHSVDFASAFTPESGAPAVGMILRWPGHSTSQGTQPYWGFYPLGCIAWFRWYGGSEKYELFGNQGVALDSDGATLPDLAPGTEYVFKAQVETVGANDVYRLKVWEVGDPEPGTWLLEGQQASAGNPAAGGIALVAHHVDVTFGDVQLRDIP